MIKKQMTQKKTKGQKNMQRKNKMTQNNARTKRQKNTNQNKTKTKEGEELVGVFKWCPFSLNFRFICKFCNLD